MEEYLRMVKGIISKDKNFPESLELAKINSLGGKIWIVGSFLYKNILKEKYNLKELVVKDYDFILEKQINCNEEIFSEEWKKEKTFFGSPRFKKEGLNVDLINLYKMNSKISKEEYLKKEPEELIKLFLRRAPFQIQSIAYEIKEEKIIDEGSIESIEKGLTKVLDWERVHSIAKKRNLSIEKYFDYKSKNLGVEIIY